MVDELSIFEPLRFYCICATREVSDQPAHPRSLIRFFAGHVPLSASRLSKEDKREALSYWVDVQADLCICWLHRSYCRFCSALAQI